jgi:4-hydroxy-3-methylbut-2-en-1-yl diphosphate reductase
LQFGRSDALKYKVTDHSMKILRAAHLGFCFGVRDALALTRARAAQGPVTLLGHLVHNEAVSADLARRGVLVRDDPADVPTRDVMVTAHGASRTRLQALERLGLNVTEATCPLVHRAHQALEKLVAEGCHPVVIGQRNHVEVRGLTEDHADCDVVLNEADIRALQRRPLFGVVAQTTQPIQRVQELVALLRARFPDSQVRFRDTVCQPTKDRQNAAIELARQCDAVVVVGGAQSNNTRELVATCLRHCARVCHVQEASELEAGWLVGVETVGVTAGTSTPDAIIEAVEKRLRDVAVECESLNGTASSFSRP